ncbi:MAG: glycosyltransferase [Deltaproteobacteria bacterium]
MKIAYLLPNLESGGTERHVLSLARRLDGSRHSLSLFTTAGGGALYGEFSALMPVTVAGDPERGKRFRSSPREHLRTVRDLARIFRKDRPDILHAYLPAANVLGPAAARLAGVRRVIVSKRAMADYKADFPLLRRVEPLGNLLADVVLVNSDAVRRDIERTERFCSGKFRKICNGVDPIAPWTREQVEDFRRREGIPPGAPVILSVSNFYPYKGLDDLVAAAPRVVASFPAAVFLLAGRDAGTMERCRALAAQGGVAENVRFLGDRTDVADCIRASDLFVHPSREEGFSNAILEAMAGSRAVVACDVGGNPEAVRDGETGLLVPPRQPSALADALVRLLADPVRREAMGEAGHRRAAKHFSTERMVTEMERLYDALMAEKR